MTAALYGSPDNPALAAFGEGVGDCVWRDPIYWHDGRAEDFGLVVLSGLHGKNADILRVYTARSVPVVVLEFAYFRDVPGYWQVGIGGINRPPDFECPHDRWDALGLSVQPSGGDPDGYILYAAQQPGDRSHGLTFRRWRELLRQAPGKVRMHPKDVPQETTLAEDLAGARMLKTLCSTSGIEALLAGVPAVADLPDRAAWGELSGETLPSVEARTELFARLAYGQWTLDEMRDGTCAAFVLNHLIPNVPVAIPEPVELPNVGATVPDLGKPKRARKAKV
jgi:hypothetical protein